jgi:hypothetical protein
MFAELFAVWRVTAAKILVALPAIVLARWLTAFHAVDGREGKHVDYVGGVE